MNKKLKTIDEFCNMPEGSFQQYLKLKNDPDLGKIEKGHVCKHNIRWPHNCSQCEKDAWSLHLLSLDLQDIEV